MAKKTTKKATKKSKVDPALVAAAEDLNEVMGLNGDDEIDVSGTTKAITAGIKKAAALIEEDDEFDDETWEVLESLGIARSSDDDEDDEEEDEEDHDDEEEDEDDEDEEEEDEEESTSKKSKKSKKAPAKKSKKSKKVEDDEDEEEDDEDEDDEDEDDKPKKKGKKAKSPRGPSAYGTALDILCKNPDMSKEKLNKALEKAGISPGAGTNTAYSSVRAIVKRLRDNGQMD